MKRKYKFLITFVLSVAAFTSCKDAEYDVKDNSVYIAEASTAKTMNVAMELTGADINITVRLAKQVDYNVTATIGINSQLIDDYNKANSTEYFLLPSEHFSLPSNAQVTIPAGEISATLKVHVNHFETQGKFYALPVTLTNIVEGNIAQSSTQSKLIYLIAKPLIVSVPVMKGYDGECVIIRPTLDWNIRTKEWTIESWVRMAGYTRNNQAIFSNLGDGIDVPTVVYIRFGDANGPYNYLQIKTLEGQVQTERDLVPNKWYHWAFVYDGITLTIYRDGEQDVRFTPPPPLGAGGTVEFQTLLMITSGVYYFPDLCAMSQVRFWKVARTPTQIKNNMYYDIDPTNSDLIGYWPMDEGEGNVFSDISGNGNNGVAGEHILQHWEHNIRFDRQ